MDAKEIEALMGVIERMRDSFRADGDHGAANILAKAAFALTAALADREYAERYRWLRALSANRGDVIPERFWELLGDELDEDFDARIDAARRDHG